ncbi:MAG: hypothetical protein ACRDGI_01285 [Candidatus Limnocylindrales bacterium]
MARSRTDELLEGWKMVAHSARRPASAPRRQISRSGLSAGTLVAVVVAIVVIIALSSRGSSQPPQPTLPAVGEPTATASVVPSAVPLTPLASEPLTSTAPESTPVAGTPTAADLAAARTAINTYIADLVHGDYAAAWAMLGPEDPLRTMTLAEYSSVEKENFKDLKGEYTITVSPPGIAPMSAWTSGLGAAPIDPVHAVLVEVDYTVLAGNNAGWDLFIVNPTPTGLKIYGVR